MDCLCDTILLNGRKTLRLYYTHFFFYQISNLHGKLPDTGRVLLVNYVVHLVLYGGIAEHKKQALIYITKISLEKVRYHH